MKEITEQIATAEKEVAAVGVERDAKLGKIANSLADSVVVDNNEVIIKKRYVINRITIKLCGLGVLLVK